MIGPLGRPLSRDAIVYLAGEVGSRLVTFGSLIVIANIVAPEQFGLSSLYFGLANLAAILIGLGLPNAVVRFHFDVHPFREVLGSIGAILGGSAVVAVALAALFAAPMASFLRVPVPLVIASVAGGVGIAFRSAWTASLRARRRSYSYATSLIGEALVAVTIVVAWSWIQGPIDYQVVSWSFALAALAIGGLAILNWSRDPGLGWNPSLARILVVFSAPLIFHAFAMYGLGSYDQVVINQTLGTTETARYAFAYRWGMAMVAVTAAFGAVWTPRFLELMKELSDPSGLDALARRALLSLAAAGAVLMIVLPVVALPFTPPEFESALVLIPVVTYGYVWYGLYTMVIAYAMHLKRTRRIAIGSVGVVLATVAFLYLLVPRLGIQAAAFLTVGAYAALFAVQWVSIRRDAIEIRFGRLAAIVAILGILPAVLWVAR
jgi:PST family polysaccharide transporter